MFHVSRVIPCKGIEVVAWDEYFGASYFSEAMQTSLLRRLQVQNLPDATPPMGQIPLFSKMAVTFVSLIGF